MVNKHYDVLVFEDLTDIRKKRKNEELDRDLGTWSFHQLQSFVEYKGEALGKKVVVIDPCYTSKACSRCGHLSKGDRKRGRFRCIERLFSLDADPNASRNIAHLGTSRMSRPSVSRSNLASVDARDRKVIEAELGYKPMNIFIGR